MGVDDRSRFRYKLGKCSSNINISFLLAMHPLYLESLFLQTCTLPIIQGFGLLFRDRCADLGMTGIEISIIITVNSAFGMGLGLINGPLLRRFGCRRIAIAGAVFHTVGLMLSAWANSFTLFIITYGILCCKNSIPQ